MSTKSGERAAGGFRDEIRQHRSHWRADRPPSIRYCCEPECVAAVRAIGYRPVLTYMTFQEYMRDFGQPAWDSLVEAAGLAIGSGGSPAGTMPTAGLSRKETPR